VLSGANWKSLQIHILFDLFFAMKTELEASKALTEFITFGDSDMRFYNPYWLAAYVFAPINTICQNMVVRLSKPLGILKGADAASKQKLFLVLKRLLLVEYFQTITTYANHDIGKDNNYFKVLQVRQDSEITELQPTEEHKLNIKTKAFMDMLLLTLPEFILQHFKEEQEQTNTNEELAAAFQFSAKTKGCYDPTKLPTIGTFIPHNLLPSTILADASLVEQYSTPRLQLMLQEKTPKKKSPLKPLRLYMNAPPPMKDAIYQPPPQPPLPSQPNIPFGKLCQDYTDTIQEIKDMAQPLEDIKKAMKTSKTKKEFQTSFADIMVQLQTIGNTTLNEECTTALDKYKKYKLEGTPIPRISTRKRKPEDDPDEEDKTSGSDDDDE
jgi:hypothetical protein